MNKFLEAIIKYPNIDERTWLIVYFSMYKETVSWPPGLPAIHCEELFNDYKFMHSFHEFYMEVLGAYDHKFNNKDLTLVINDKIN